MEAISHLEYVNNQMGKVKCGDCYRLVNVYHVLRYKNGTQKFVCAKCFTKKNGYPATKETLILTKTIRFGWVSKAITPSKK